MLGGGVVVVLVRNRLWCEGAGEKLEVAGL